MAKAQNTLQGQKPSAGPPSESPAKDAAFTVGAPSELVRRTHFAYGAALEFLIHLDVISAVARLGRRPNDSDGYWKHIASSYSMTFIAMHELTESLDYRVRKAARRVYPPNAPVIRMGRARPRAT